MRFSSRASSASRSSIPPSWPERLVSRTALPVAGIAARQCGCPHPSGPGNSVVLMCAGSPCLRQIPAQELIFPIVRESPRPSPAAAKGETSSNARQRPAPPSWHAEQVGIPEGTCQLLLIPGVAAESKCPPQNPLRLDLMRADHVPDPGLGDEAAAVACGGSAQIEFGLAAHRVLSEPMVRHARRIEDRRRKPGAAPSCSVPRSNPGRCRTPAARRR